MKQLNHVLGKSANILIRLFISIILILALGETTSNAQQKIKIARKHTSVYTKQDTINVGDTESYIEYGKFSLNGNVIFLKHRESIAATLPPNWVNYSRDNSPIFDNFVDISEDTSGNIWVITRVSPFKFTCNLAMFDGIKWVSFNKEDGLASNKYYAIKGDSKGNVWVATSAGVCIYDGKNWSIASTSKDFMHHRFVRVFLEDSKGNIWVGTSSIDGKMNGSVASYDGSKWTEHKAKGITKFTGVSTIFEDSKSRIWVGVGFKDGKNGRIRSFDGVEWTFYKPKMSDPKSGPPDKRVTSITEDRDGNIWIGVGSRRGDAFGGGAGSIRKFDGSGWTTISEEIGSRANKHLKITNSILDKNGNIWFSAGVVGFGQNGGVYKHDGSNWSIYTDENGLPSNCVYDIMESRDGTVWIASHSGISRFDGNNWVQELDLDRRAWKIFEDSKGNIWFGTGPGGLYKYSLSK